MTEESSRGETVSWRGMLIAAPVMRLVILRNDNISSSDDMGNWREMPTAVTVMIWVTGIVD